MTRTIRYFKAFLSGLPFLQKRPANLSSTRFLVVHLFLLLFSLSLAAPLLAADGNDTQATSEEEAKKKKPEEGGNAATDQELEEDCD